MEAAKRWKEIQILKSIKSNAMSVPGAHSATKKRRGHESNDSTNFAGHGMECDCLPDHLKQKKARLSAGSRAHAPGASRLRRVFVHCSAIVNSDAFRCSEDIMAGVDTLHKELVASCTEYVKRGGETLYFQVLMQRHDLETLVYWFLDTSDPEPSKQSRHRSECLEQQDLPQLLNAVTTREMTLAHLNEFRAACLVASTEEDLADWVRTFTSAVQLGKQLRLADKANNAAARILGNAAFRRLEAEQKGAYAAAMAALKASLQLFQPNGSVFELPPEAGDLFPTVTEDVFLKMSVAQRAKMSVQPLLIQGCSKLKWQLANIPQLQAVMHPTTSKFFHGAGRRSADTSMN